MTPIKVATIVMACFGFIAAIVAAHYVSDSL
ncbi:hypothetical protein RPPS3_09000 [Rhodopseudomonas palustris]|nr:hypothetical protein RPPS3_09000 [Rhodopseudomonas palustris]